ncbi:hypothetical protein BU202_02855 [Streptococcus cuniculi]|uniref:Fungal lipase-like domain-containing protein n=1 Tax=Streptococcus cuniculi TaxID=1432788 RepID=A0A1Q8E9X0_9STRE|nr:hypothetical protein [Streptococcus cuniculi]OLF48573.1 hypothetical protein BU202_02855 [Streptococcus cuniculi]
MAKTDEQLNLLSQQSYWVDSSRSDVKYHPKVGKDYYYNYKDKSIGRFRVLKVADNQTNGMQAMAVAPVVNGEVDYSQITIAYAGTNFSDGKDRQTDLNSIIGGQNYFETAPRLSTDSQIDTALDFAADIKRTYPQATISTTGHSLGAYLATLVAIKNKWASTVFNGPSPANMLTEEEIAWAKAHTDILVNYRNTRDWVGNYGGDPLGIARYVDSYKDAGIFAILYYHGLSTWEFDAHGNLIDKYGFIVDQKNYQAGIDIDGDGVEDIHLSPENVEPRNLFLSSGNLILAGGKTIKINPDSLRMLSSNLNILAMIEIPAMIRVCQLCQEKNTKIAGDFNTRKQKVEESIVQRFKETRLTEVFYRLHDSLGQMMSKQHIFDHLSSPQTLVNTISNPAYLASGAYLELSSYNSMLSRLAATSQQLAQQLTDEKTSGFQNGFPINPTPTALKSSAVLEESAKRLKKKSETIFEGMGLREGKKDGISQSLTEVLEVEQKNLKELQTAVENVSRLTLSLANNFKGMDEWLQGQLSSGGNMADFSVQNVPASYQVYLEESAIFDDVKDVLQAFDQQVEKRSNQYAKEVAVAFSDAFQQVQASLERWTEQLTSFNQTVDAVKDSFDIDIYVDKKKMVDDEPVVTRTYWGQLVRLYGSITSVTIRSAYQEIPPLTDKVVEAIEITRSAKSDMQHLKPQLKAIIEEGVYTAFDLDEIVASQKTIQIQIKRIMQEFNYVITTISSQMTGQAITRLSEQLGNVHQLTSYFNQLVGDCFGDQGGGETLPSGVLALQANRFSLNK